MDSKVKALWLEELRSGEREQGRGALREGNKFCCLGVLSDIAARCGIGSWQEVPHMPTLNFSTGSESRDNGGSFLAYGVIKWAGLEDRNPMIAVEGERIALAELNDGNSNDRARRLTFNQIADMIERFL